MPGAFGPSPPSSPHDRLCFAIRRGGLGGVAVRSIERSDVSEECGEWPRCNLNHIHCPEQRSHYLFSRVRGTITIHGYTFDGGLIGGGGNVAIFGRTPLLPGAFGPSPPSSPQDRYDHSWKLNAHTKVAPIKCFFCNRVLAVQIKYGSLPPGQSCVARRLRSLSSVVPARSFGPLLETKKCAYEGCTNEMVFLQPSLVTMWPNNLRWLSLERRIFI